MYEQGPDDPTLTSQAGFRAKNGILSDIPAKGGWQFTRSEWMDILKEAHGLLRQDPNNPKALRAMAEFQSAFHDPVFTENPSALATAWQGAKDIFKAGADWLLYDVPTAITQMVTEPPAAAHAVGQATGIGNWGKIFDTGPTNDQNPVTRHQLQDPNAPFIPSFGLPNTGMRVNPEFQEASVPDKLERIVQALPTNIPYQVTRKLWEGTGALDQLPWNKNKEGVTPSEPVGTYETTKNVLDMATLPLGLTEAGGIPKGGSILPEAKPFPITRGAGRGAIKAGQAVQGVGERVKAVIDMPRTFSEKMKAQTKVDLAREAEVNARAEWHKARTQAQTIKNQGGTASEQAAAKIKADLANVKLKQAEQKLKTYEQEHAQGTRKGEIIEETITRGPKQTKGVDLSNTLKELKIQQMQSRAKGKGGVGEGGEAGLGDESLWEGVDETPPPEPPLNPRSRKPTSKPTPAPATSKPAKVTTSVEAPAKSPAAKKVKPKITPKSQTPTITEAQLVSEVEKMIEKGEVGTGGINVPVDAPVHPVKPKITPAGEKPAVVPRVKNEAAAEARRLKRVEKQNAKAGKGPREPVAPAGAEPKTPHPDDVQSLGNLPENKPIMAALEKVAQETQQTVSARKVPPRAHERALADDAAKGPTRTIEPPATKSGQFEYPPFREDLNIGQTKKWPAETQAAIQNYLDEIKKNLEYSGETAPINFEGAPGVMEAGKPVHQGPFRRQVEQDLWNERATAKPKPKITPQESPAAKAARLAEEAAEQARLTAEAEKVRQRRAAKNKGK